MKIGNVEIENPVVIAPMAGITNPAFRQICKQFKAGLVYTEMVSDKAICFENKKTLGMTEVLEDEHPLTMQIFGHDIDSMVQAAKFLDTRTDCDIIDVNMGCPVNKIVKSNAGSALMRDEEYAAELMHEIIKHVKKPVTVKMRIGWDSESKNCVSLAKKLESAGVSAIALHGRTKTQMYEGKADWSYIKKVKEAVQIPVIGNGDVRSVEDMIAMLEETGCDMVMIGRGVLGDPWLIQRCVHYLETGEIIQDTGVEEKFDLAYNHAVSLCELKGERVGMKEMRGHAAWYMKSLKYSHRVKEKISMMSTLDEFQDILVNYKNSLENDDWNWLER
ncbi:tRNA dihydrouridine synthase DusB [uncultured Traorella sp.]|uniref:tRNA dihydrouridine synthase DusB n=1 Tax=uncultured Traorella sp. TaxID=1929048 RepID=UPI0025DD49E3|nr:tRNA dihydrouridine synthase DusB [uncultured Traorella sp.]